jgi:hypothetical protein
MMGMWHLECYPLLSLNLHLLQQNLSKADQAALAPALQLEDSAPLHLPCSHTQAASHL